MNFNHLLNIDVNSWQKHGVALSAASFDGRGFVTAALAKYKGQKYYIHRKHEFINGVFTGKESFIVETVNK